MLLAGPVLWLAALLAVAVVTEKTDFILVGLVIAGGSLLLGSAMLLSERARRVREEREAAPRR